MTTVNQDNYLYFDIIVQACSHILQSSHLYLYIYIYYQLLYSCIVVHIVCIYRHICFLISSQLFFFLNKRMHACMQGGEFSNKTVVERKTFVVIPLIFWPIFLRNKHHNSWCSVSSLFLLIKQTNDHHKDAIILSSFLFWPYIHFLYLLHFSLILLRIRFVLFIDDSYFSVFASCFK